MRYWWEGRRRNIESLGLISEEEIHSRIFDFLYRLFHNEQIIFGAPKIYGLLYHHVKIIIHVKILFNMENIS